MKNIILGYNECILKKQSFSNILSNLKIILLVILAFRSMEPYVFWGKGVLTVFINLLLIFVFFIQYIYKYNSIHFSYLKVTLLSITWFLLFLYIHVIWTTSIKNIIISFISIFIPVIILFLSSEEEKKDFIKQFTNFFSVLLFLSLIEYLLVVFGILNIHPKKLYYPNSDFYQYFDNYGLFIVVFDLRNFFIPRFQAFLTEPGHLGMMCALFLYANSYNLRDIRNVVIFISALLSMSLASYVLLLAGFFLYKYSVSNKKLLMATKLLLIFIILVVGAMIYYKQFPESEFSTAIIERLLPDEEKGISGNNRTKPAFQKAFSEQMSKIDFNSLFGYGKNALEEKLPKAGGNSSGTVFIFMYGIIGGILLSLFYITITSVYYSNAIIGMLVLYFISFIQRPYATWLAQIFIMFSSAVNFREIFLLKNNNYQENGNLVKITN